jgi:hypothetical protein
MIVEMITSKAVGVRPDGYRDPSWAQLNYSWLQFIFYTPFYPSTLQINFT